MKRSEVDRSKLSPMMAQYMEIKDQYPEELVFYRLGDFYEMFFDDALLASRELELTLTGRVAGLDERVPMCGVPHNNVKSYIEKLVNKGYRVAICEQLEDPKTTGNRMVKRGIVDVISKGTIADNDLLNERDSSYIAGILFFQDMINITILDISTSYLANLSIENNQDTLLNEILNYNIKEVVLLDNLNTTLIDLLKNTYNIEVTINEYFLKDKYTDFLNTISDIRIRSGVEHLFYYLSVRQLKDLSHINHLEIIKRADYVEMDVHTVRNLELVETIRLKERTYSLVWLLDKCKTAMGSRKLKSWILNPLKNRSIIESRYAKIEKLNNEFILKDELRDLLYEVYDIERLAGKVINGSLNARDLLQLKNSLAVLPKIQEISNKLGFAYDIDIFINSVNPITQLIYLDKFQITLHGIPDISIISVCTNSLFLFSCAFLSDVLLTQSIVQLVNLDIITIIKFYSTHAYSYSALTARTSMPFTDTVPFSSITRHGRPLIISVRIVSRRSGFTLISASGVETLNFLFSAILPARNSVLSPTFSL